MEEGSSSSFRPRWKRRRKRDDHASVDQFGIGFGNALGLFSCDEIPLFVQEQVGEAVFEGRAYIEIDENLLLAMEPDESIHPISSPTLRTEYVFPWIYFDVALKTRYRLLRKRMMHPLGLNDLTYSG